MDKLEYFRFSSRMISADHEGWKIVAALISRRPRRSRSLKIRRPHRALQRALAASKIA